MSIKVITHVWENSKQKGSALLMMLAIADNANDEGEAWPSLKTLAHKTRMSKRNAQMVIKKLEESGELAVKERRVKDSDNETNLFTINVPWLAKAAKSQRQGVKPTSSGNEADCIPGGEAHFMPGVKSTSSKPSLEPSLEPIASSDAAVSPEQSPKKRVSKHEPHFQALVTAFGIDATKLTRSGNSLYWKAAYELYEAKFPVEQVINLYKWCKAQNWKGFTAIALAAHAADWLATNATQVNGGYVAKTDVTNGKNEMHSTLMLGGMEV